MEQPCCGRPYSSSGWCHFSEHPPNLRDTESLYNCKSCLFNLFCNIIINDVKDNLVTRFAGRNSYIRVVQVNATPPFRANVAGIINTRNRAFH